ncbi:hypothetical protein [Enterobacter roggenkampii]|uniref:hypothetical protein n=1 Tax=Enterobacter roggenkampii TaxID=1812935 RepID=UPI00398B65F5
MKKLIMVSAVISLLAACTSPAQRMAECKAQGISKDACYVAEQNKQAAVNAAAQKQAMENARALYPVQKAQSAKKITYTGEGLTLVLTDKTLTVDGKLAALDEDNADAKSYSQGLYNFVIYKNGKIAIMKGGQFVSYAKKSL